jgi:hypothetical protein
MPTPDSFVHPDFINELIENARDTRARVAPKTAALNRNPDATAHPFKRLHKPAGS